MATTRIASRTLVLTRGSRTWEVRPGTVVRLGRHSTNAIALPDHRCSRFHAQISWDGFQAAIEDLGSMNGTFVDGMRVRGRMPLRSGQRILVGRTKLGVEFLELEQQVFEDEDDDEDTSPGDERQGVFRCKRTLHRLLVDLEFERQTGVLSLSLGVRRAAVVFYKGRVIAARHQQLRGEAALDRILEASVGSYCFGDDWDEDETVALGPSLDVSLEERFRRGLPPTRRHLRWVA